MRTVLYGGGVAALAFSVCMVALSWFKDSAASGATQDAAFDIALAEDICSAENPSGNTAGEEMAHDHPLLEVLKDAPVPTVTHLVFPDAMDGYNIQILTENFTFTPAAINSAAVPNEGHAHLYVNGEKISRVYRELGAFAREPIGRWPQCGQHHAERQ